MSRDNQGEGNFPQVDVDAENLESWKLGPTEADEP